MTFENRLQFITSRSVSIRCIPACLFITSSYVHQTFIFFSPNSLVYCEFRQNIFSNVARWSIIIFLFRPPSRNMEHRTSTGWLSKDWNDLKTFFSLWITIFKFKIICGEMSLKKKNAIRKCETACAKTITIKRNEISVAITKSWQALEW